jgi:hypothetical protein
VNAATLGLTVSLAIQPSTNSSVPHAVLQVQAPLLVTSATDAAYFKKDPAYAFDPFAAFLPPAFVNDERGVTPKFLGSPIGVVPYAAPQLAPLTFPFCATIADDNGTHRAAVAAFYAIGTSGTTYVSTPLVSAPTACPAS